MNLDSNQWISTSFVISFGFGAQGDGQLALITLGSNLSLLVRCEELGGNWLTRSYRIHIEGPLAAQLVFERRVQDMVRKMSPEMQRQEEERQRARQAKLDAARRKRRQRERKAWLQTHYPWLTLVAMALIIAFAAL